MPIIGLTDRGAQFPRIGELRKGAPKPTQGNKPGADLKHFRFTSTSDDVVKSFYNVFGNEPNEIRVFLPYQTTEENFESWIEEWGAGSLKWRGDGKTLHIWQTSNGTYSHEPKPQPENKGKQVGRLKVIIPELGRLAYVVALTTSIHDIMELSSNLTAYEAMAGGLQGIPFILSRVPRMVSTPGKNGRVRREKWLLHIEAAPEWVAAQLSVMQHAALPGANDDMLMIESGEPDFDVDDDGVIFEHEAIAPAPQAEATQTRTPDEVARALNAAAEGKTNIANEKQLKFVRASLSKLVDGNHAAAKSILAFLFGVSSSTELTTGEASAVIDWAGAKKENDYTANDTSIKEAAAIIRQVNIDAGQAPLFDDEPEMKLNGGAYGAA